MPHRLVSRRFRQRLGRRGVLLALFGVMWVLMGIAYLVVPEMTSQTQADTAFWHERLPAPALAGVWGISGLLSIYYGFKPRRDNDTTGFLAVSAPPMLLTFSFLVGAFTRIVLGDPSWVLGVIGFVLYGVFAFALGVIASWPDSEGE